MEKVKIKCRTVIKLSYEKLKKILGNKMIKLKINLRSAKKVF